MYRFANVTYDHTTQTATIGAGLIWDDVYTALEPYGVNLAGGRVSGIGVAGFTLGGGKSASPHILRLGSNLMHDGRSHRRNAVTRVLLARESVWFNHRHSECIRTRIAKRYCNKCHCFPDGSILFIKGRFSCTSDLSLHANYVQGGFNNFVSNTYIR